MSTAAKATTERERKRQAAACERATGMFQCMGGYHQARGEPVLYRGRKYCSGCLAKITERARR